MNAIPEIPNELVSAIGTGKCAVFVGAGASQAAGYPGWKKLLLDLTTIALDQKVISKEKRDELKSLLNDSSKWLMVAQELLDVFEKPQFHSELAKLFEKIDGKPSSIHKIIPDIPFTFALTTNYDLLLENAYATKLKHIPKIYTHQDVADFADALWKQAFFILKAHGDIQRKSSIILTERDYRKLVYSSPGYRALLAAIFTTKTVFFVGASLSDPEIQLLLRSLHDSFQGSGQHHYAIVSEKEFGETEVGQWRKNYNIQCIRYTPSTGHPEVEAFMQQLRNKTKGKSKAP